jgi:hypothetical protein
MEIEADPLREEARLVLPLRQLSVGPGATGLLGSMRLLTLDVSRHGSAEMVEEFGARGARGAFESPEGRKWIIAAAVKQSQILTAAQQGEIGRGLGEALNGFGVEASVPLLFGGGSLTAHRVDADGEERMRVSLSVALAPGVKFFTSDGLEFRFFPEPKEED